MADYLLGLHGQLPNGEAWSSFRRMTSTRSPAAMLAAWGAAWDAAWTDGTHGLQNRYPVNTTLTSYTCATLDVGFHELAKISLTTSQAGVNTNEALPANTAVVLSWRSSTDIRRTARGHQSLPAPSNDQVANDKIDPTHQGLISAAVNAVRTSLTADGSTFFVFNRDRSIITGLPALTKTVIDTVTCRNKLGTFERRFRKEPATYI